LILTFLIKLILHLLIDLKIILVENFLLAFLIDPVLFLDLRVYLWIVKIEFFIKWICIHNSILLKLWFKHQLMPLILDNRVITASTHLCFWCLWIPTNSSWSLEFKWSKHPNCWSNSKASIFLTIPNFEYFKASAYSNSTESFSFRFAS